MRVFASFHENAPACLTRTLPSILANCTSTSAFLPEATERALIDSFSDRIAAIDASRKASFTNSSRAAVSWTSAFSTISCAPASSGNSRAWASQSLARLMARSASFLGTIAWE